MSHLKLYLCSLLLLCTYGSAIVPVNAQVNSVKVKLEIDGKQLNKGFKLRIYPDKESYNKDKWHTKGIRPKVEQNTFTVPIEIKKQETVAYMIIEFREYELTYFDVPIAAFEAADWVVGIDSRPFESVNVMQSISEKDIDYAYYLKFINKEGKDVKILVN